ACRHYISARPAIPSISPSASVHGDASTYTSIQRAYDDMKERIDQEALMREHMRTSGRDQYAAAARYAAVCRIGSGRAVDSEPFVRNADGSCHDFKPRKPGTAVCERCRNYRRAQGPEEERAHREKMARADLYLKGPTNFLGQAMDNYGREKALEVNTFTA